MTSMARPWSAIPLQFDHFVLAITEVRPPIIHRTVAVSQNRGNELKPNTWSNIMTTALNTQNLRSLTSAELDIVSGAAPIVIRLPGQVTVSLNKESGCFAVTLGGKDYAQGGCGGPTIF